MSQNLFKAERVLEINLVESGYAIETICEEYLKEPPKGIYSHSKLEPVMVDGQEYFVNVGTTTKLVTDINDETTAIYDSNNKKIITMGQMRNKATQLSNQSFHPYYGIHIAFKMLQYYVDQYCAYLKNKKSPFHSIDKYFIDNTFKLSYGVEHGEKYSEIVEERTDPAARFEKLLDHILSEQRTQIFEFMNSKNWNMHVCKLDNTTFRVEQCMDYRAYLWELEHGEQWHAGTYTAGSF